MMLKERPPIARSGVLRSWCRARIVVAMRLVSPTASEARFIRLFLLSFVFLLSVATAFIAHRIAPRFAAFSLQFLSVWRLGVLTLILIAMGITLFTKQRVLVVWESVFVLILFFGSWFLFLLLLPFPSALLLASAFTIAHLFGRNTLLHNLFFGISAIGIAIAFAGWFSSDLLMGGLVLFSLYDMLAEPAGGPILGLAERLVHRGIVPGFLCPSSWRDVISSVDTVVKREAVLLGVGDVLLPLALVARAAFVPRWWPSIVVLGGLLLAVSLLLSRDLRHPRIAVPVMAAGVLIPFLVLRFFLIV